MKSAEKPRPVEAFRLPLSRADGRAALASFGNSAPSGICVRLFEMRLAGALGMPRAVALNSGTAALHLALKVAGVEGGEVITTPLTSPATNHAILHNRATPVFCDVDPETGNLDPRRVEAALTRGTKAVVAVHFNGLPCAMDELRSLVRGRGIVLIEDAGAALPSGGFYKGRPVGSLGDLACFSFSRKNFTTLDGGAVVCRRADWAERLARLRNLGQPEGDGPQERSRRLSEAGFAFRMNDLSAAIGLAQFERWPKTAARLARIEAIYRRGLAGIVGILPPPSRPRLTRSPACFAVRAAGGKGPLREELARAGIGTDDWLHPNHLFPLYKPWRRRLPAAETLAGELVYLPFYPGLTDEEARRVVRAVGGFSGRR